MAIESQTQTTGLPALIPREVLFGNAERSQPRISPDGRRLAFLAPHEGVMNLHVAQPDGSAPRPVTAERVSALRMYQWAADSRHLVFLQDAGGTENFHLYTVDLDSGEVVDRTPYENVRAMLVGIEPSHPGAVLFALNR